MAYDRQTRLRAVELYLEHRNVAKVARVMDGPSRSCIESWIAAAVGVEKRNPTTQRFTVEDKVCAITRVQAGEVAPSVARSMGVSPGAVYHWMNRYEKLGALGLMGKQDERKHLQAPPERLDSKPAASRDDELEELRQELADTKLELDLLKGLVDIVKKDQGADLESLSNREKTALIDALRPMHSLTCLISRLRIAASSYHYSHAALAMPDKHEAVRCAIVEEFAKAHQARGYRYIYHQLRKRADIGAVGEKKVRSIMAEEGLMVIYDKRRKRRYSSYAGEISEAPGNLVNRDFHADRPNTLWLTDITEFRLPGGSRKVYLSPVLDCFDGALVSWSIATSPNAELANSSLAKACEKLRAGEHPVCHTDRGSHYRWPGWLSICERFNIVRSMSKKGCSPDNSACEGLFGRLKNEFFHYRDWSGVSTEEFMERLDAWLRYYNDGRIKKSLGWKSPMQYRRSLGIAA